MTRFLIFFIIGFMITANSIYALNFELLNQQNLPGSKFAVDIITSKKLSKLELSSAARAVENQLCAILETSRPCRSVFPRIFITWYLPGMEIGAGAWATTHFDPTLKINIMDWMLEYNPTTLTE